MLDKALIVYASLLFVAKPLHADDVHPNIILVFADDMGINDLGCYGRNEHRTPHIDKLADEGMRFACAYCAQPICSPSRAALMTGKSPVRLHLTNYLPGRPNGASQRLLHPRIEGQLPLEETTIAELLRDAGYATGMFGKWHLGGEGFGPLEQGFDVAMMPPANTEPSSSEGGKGEYAITAAAEQFIEETRDRPFFCYVAHNTPHIPLGARKELIEKNRGAFHPVYAAMMETLDDTVGRLTRKIESLGLGDRTIFVFTSDNGGLNVLESSGTPATHNTPFRAGKGYVYEGGLREPLIIRWPGLTPAGSVCDEPVVLTDLVPTLLKAAGIDAATTVGPLDGDDVTALLLGESLAQRTLFWHFPHYTNQGSRPAGAVRQGEWKLIEQYEDGALELYNLASDPGETTNVAAEHGDRVASLRDQLHSWRERLGAQQMEPNPDFDAALNRRLYVDADPSRLAAAATARQIEPAWKEWRQGMNGAVRGNRPAITPAEGDVRLFARDAEIHAKTMRYEPEPHKDVLGYWTRIEDWAEWEFVVPRDARYEVEVQQGCGKGSGGSEVEVIVGGHSLRFAVQDTGHFQQMILRVIGEVDLPKGACTLQVKPQTKPGVAVMDLRRVVLRPAS